VKAVKDILVGPVLTEKSSDLRFGKNQYVFSVRMDANKIEIKKAVETRFNVIVDNVSTLVMRGKTKNVRGVPGRKPSWKKAFVRIRQGDKISEFEGA
jgi:large subunit ribosomal protein L23